jgi:PAS domain S-box-containing protein
MNGIDIIGFDIIGIDYKIHFQDQTLKKRFKSEEGDICYEKYLGTDKPCDPCPMVLSIKDRIVKVQIIRGLDGRYYQIYSAPLQNPDGTCDRAIELIIDITDRKLIEEKLRTSEEQYKFILENCFDMISVMAQGKLVYVNQAHERLLGHSIEEWLGPIENVAKWLHPDDLAKFAREIAMDHSKGGHLTSYIRVRHKDGHYLWFEGRAQTFSKDNETITIIISRDITDRKQAEEELMESDEKYKDLFMNSPLGIFLFDGEGTLIDGNTTIDDLFLGYTLSDNIGKSFTEIISALKNSDEISQIFQKRQQDRQKGKKLEPIEFRIVIQNGEERWIYWQSSLLKLKDKELIQVIVQDITKRKLAEVKLKNYAKELERQVELKTDKLRGETQELQETLQKLNVTREQLVQSEKLASIGLLTAGIAHEINNPLMGIINYAQILKDEISKNNIHLDEKPLSFLDNLLKEGQRIAGIIQGLMSFARKDDGYQALVDISQIIDSALFLLAHELRNAHIKIDLKLDHNQIKPLAKSQSLRQVIVNVLHNSIDALNEKYGILRGAGQKQVAISTSIITKENKRYLKIEIWDNGQGIKPENLQRIFDPFFTTKKASKAGLGLGLSVSYGIIKDHGGEISIKSMWEEYTATEILLPIRKV